MAYLDNEVYDNGLSALAGTNRVLHICGTEPTTYAQATSTYTLGNKTSPTVGSPANRSGGGREVTISAITDGTVTGTGTAGFWALVDTGNTRLLAVEALSATQAVTEDNTFTLTAITVGIPGVA